MKHATHNLFKQEKKLKHLERKKQRSNKQKGLVFWGNVETIGKGE